MISRLAKRRGGSDERHRDAGTTLMELMVGMGIMGVFLVIFTGAITMMYNSLNKSETLNDTTAQINRTFDTLDTQVRYATAISAPGQGASKDWYVEFQSVNNSTTPATTTCTQLRLNQSAKQLQSKTWTVTTSPLDGSTSATNVANQSPLANTAFNNAASPANANPFVVNPATQASPHQSLQIILSVTSGADKNATTSSNNLTFTAMNSQFPASAPAAICTEVPRA